MRLRDRFAANNMGTSIARRSALNPRRYTHLAIVFGFVCCVWVNHRLPAATTDLPLLKTTALFGQLGGINERRTADNLIKRARELMNEGNLELAEWYVEKVEKLNVKYDGLWSRIADTPQKLRADLIRLSAKKKLAEAAKQQEPPTPSQRFQPQPAVPLPTPQPAVPSTSGADSASGSTLTSKVNQLTDDSRIRSKRYLDLGRQALASGNTVAALGYYRSSLATGATFNDDEYSPAKLAQELRNAGIDETRLQIVSAAPPMTSPNVLDPARLQIQDPQIPSVLDIQLPGSELRAADGPKQQFDAIPSTSPAPKQSHWETKRTEAVRLLAESQLALDRGDLKTAERLALKAQDLRVPDKAYQPNDKRPWMLLMEVGRQQNRSLPMIEAPPMAPAPNEPARSQVGVSTVYDPITDPTPPVALTAGEEVVTSPPAFPAPPVVRTAEALPISPAPPVEEETGPYSEPGLTGELLSQSPAPSTNSPVQELVTPPDDAEKPFAFQPQQPPDVLPQLPPASALPAAESDAADASDLRLNESSQARRLFQQGVAALKAHNTERAWRLFVEAWQRQDEMDPNTREELQGYLQLLAEPADSAEQSDDGPSQSLQQLNDEEREQLRRFVSEVTREQATIRRLQETRPKDAWEQLKQLRQKVASADVNDESRSRLLSRVDRSIREMEAYIEQNRPTIELDERNREMLADVKRRREQRLRNQQDLAEFVDQFNTLMDQQRFFRSGSDRAQGT